MWGNFIRVHDSQIKSTWRVTRYSISIPTRLLYSKSILFAFPPETKANSFKFKDVYTEKTQFIMKRCSLWDTDYAEMSRDYL